MERMTGCAMSVRAHRPQQSTSLRGEREGYTSELKLSSVNLGARCGSLHRTGKQMYFTFEICTKSNASEQRCTVQHPCAPSSTTALQKFGRFSSLDHQENALATLCATRICEAKREPHLDKVSATSIRTAEVTIERLFDRPRQLPYA